jgi:serine/threonine protein kinase
MVSVGDILGGHWKIERFIGEGACAKVYSVAPNSSYLKASQNNGISDNFRENVDMVAKVISLGGEGKSKKAKDQNRICNTLNYEYMLYTGILFKFPLRPYLPPMFYGTDKTFGVRFLVMEKLDLDLAAFSKRKNITSNEIADLGLAILNGLQWIHQKGFLFIDVKPENFMLKEKKLFFIDCKIFSL